MPRTYLAIDMLLFCSFACDVGLPDLAGAWPVQYTVVPGGVTRRTPNWSLAVAARRRYDENRDAVPTPGMFAARASFSCLLPYRRREADFAAALRTTIYALRCGGLTVCSIAFVTQHFTYYCVVFCGVSVTWFDLCWRGSLPSARRLCATHVLSKLQHVIRTGGVCDGRRIHLTCITAAPARFTEGLPDQYDAYAFNIISSIVAFLPDACSKKAYLIFNIRKNIVCVQALQPLFSDCCRCAVAFAFVRFAFCC